MPLYAEDSSSSREPSVDPDSSNMTDIKADRASTDGISPPPGNHGCYPNNKSNAKDPLRPRRKKARRACFACQRAHLTCGDERPCLRCVKRGLQEHCQDGVRKKAKYLHDAPAEALAPGFGNNYLLNSSQSLNNMSVPATVPAHSLAGTQPGNYFPPNSQTAFPQYGPPTQQGQMGPPMIDKASIALADFAPGATEPPTPYQSGSSQQVSPVQDLGHPIDQNNPIRSSVPQSFDAAFLDPNDTQLFNFNARDFNFGNHYGALEFGFLGHMSGAMGGASEVDALNAMGPANQGSMAFDNAGAYHGSFGYNQPYAAWQSVPNNSISSRHGSGANVWNPHHAGSDAFAIGEQPASLTGASPHSQNQDYSGYQNTLSPGPQFPHAEQDDPHDLLRHTLQPRKPGVFHPEQHSEANRKRRRRVTDIYTSVSKPYSYTQGFHALTAFLRSHYPSRKVMRIAKALSRIRPSFISCNQNLHHEDLIFMEKCFQRSLCEYDDFVNHYATPTIICRRTGEIAAASKEFSLVTGWRRDVLLGKEPNLNIHTGAQLSGDQPGGASSGGANSRGTVTPRLATVTTTLDMETSRPQPVFLAELMDEDSVVQFYEDFAELAFGASRTSIIGAPCSLLKYRAKDDIAATAAAAAAKMGGSGGAAGTGAANPRSSQATASEPIVSRMEAGVNALGDKDGRVDCQMSWTVRRDVFDIPMLIVMNFLPII